VEENICSDAPSKPQFALNSAKLVKYFYKLKHFKNQLHRKWHNIFVEMFKFSTEILARFGVFFLQAIWA